MTHSKNIFPDVPNKTTAACHDVNIEDAAPIKQHPYRLNPLKREVMRKSKLAKIYELFNLTGCFKVSKEKH
jgi:hypothetical protein